MRKYIIDATEMLNFNLGCCFVKHFKFNPNPQDPQVILHKTLPLQYFVMSHVFAKIAPFNLPKREKMKRYLAEFFGTFWLVFGGCGSAIFAAAFPELGIGFVGVALAFGLTVLTMAYAVGHISGGHFNPAVSVGLLVGGRFDKKDFVPYVIAQVIGAIAAAGVLYLIASGKAFSAECCKDIYNYVGKEFGLLKKQEL